VVTVAYDPLRQRLGMGGLDLGGNLAPEAARRIACDAHIIPAVLDVGRTKRLVVGPRTSHRPLGRRRPDIPGYSVLLCGHHHRLIRRGEWQVRTADDGLP
jgi:hypothetical protein